MPTIGVRELKSQASEIVRLIREDQAEYVVTLRGEPVAVLLPVERRALQAQALRPPESAALTMAQQDLAKLRERAINLAGRFHSGVADISEQHDRYLAEVFTT